MKTKIKKMIVAHHLFLSNPKRIKFETAGKTGGGENGTKGALKGFYCILSGYK